MDSNTQQVVSLTNDDMMLISQLQAIIAQFNPAVLDAVMSKLRPAPAAAAAAVVETPPIQQDTDEECTTHSL